MEESQVSQSQRAVGRAIYSPRFVDGQPVSTAGVTFTSEWYQEYDPESAPQDSTPISTTPESTAEEPVPEKKPASGSGG
jgi:hypothetical protein